MDFMKVMLSKESLEFNRSKTETAWKVVVVPELAVGSEGCLLSITRKKDGSLDVISVESDRVDQDEDGEDLPSPEDPLNIDDATIEYNGTTMFSEHSIEDIAETLRDPAKHSAHMSDNWPKGFLKLLQKPWVIKDFVV